MLLRKLILFSPLFFLFSCNNTNTSNTLFQKVSHSHSGINFQNILRETEDFNVLNYGYFYNGGGVAVGDLNNDEKPDIYFTGNLVASHLYLNKGNLRFDEIAEQAGVSAAGLWNTGTAMADVNGDGWLDIYVCRSAAADPNNRKNLLFINDANGVGERPTFSEQGETYGLADPAYSTQAAFFDYDRDGDLDMYLLNHSTQDYAGFSRTLGQLKHKINPYFGDKLYRNDEGKFKNINREAGIISNVLGFGLGIAISDVNQDHWPDIYISNDYNEQDYLYINQKDGTFKESLSETINHVSLFSMGSDIADINNDGMTDILTLDMLPEDNFRQKMTSGPDHYEKNQVLKQNGFYHQTMRNMLQLNNGNGTFSEIGQLAGVSNTDWSWAALFADYDNDGYNDLFVSNGYKRDYTNMDFMSFTVAEQMKARKSGVQPVIQKLLEKMPAIETPNYIYKNNGDLTFRKINKAWGMEEILLSNGAAYADLDADGDLDIITNNVNEYASIYENHANTQLNNHFLRIKLQGSGKNTHGIGAKIWVKTESQEIFREQMPVRGFQSSVDPVIHIGLGKDSIVEEVKIIWPKSGVQFEKNVSVDSHLIIAENPTKKETLEKNVPIFTDTTSAYQLFTHKENVFVDFKREILLPQMLSTQGPKMSKGDINKDGREDFFIGGAKGQVGSLFVQDASGKFKPIQNSVFEGDKMSEDLESLFFDADGDGDMDLYVCSGGSDFQENALELQDRLYLNQNGRFQKAVDALPQMLTSTLSVSAADIEGDGDLDLFVGGRLVPGKYPITPRSYLLINDGKGKFSDETETLAPELSNIGMVCDAAWTDINQDKKPDLVIVGEWMPISFFQNVEGKLQYATESTDQPINQSTTSGWWNCLLIDDLDGDGDEDIIVGNHGLNAQFQATETKPVEIYYKDFDQNGAIDPIMTYFIDSVSYPMASKDDLLGQLAHLKKKYVSYASYADATISTIFSEEELEGVEKLQAHQMKTTWFENKGNGKYEERNFPIEAQFAPVYAIASFLKNEDGSKNLLMAGNFSGNRVKFGESDANFGQLFTGDKDGNFEYIPQYASGFKLRGDVRDILVLDVGNESKVKVFFALNNGELVVYTQSKTD